MPSGEMAELQQTICSLRRCVGSLRAQLGDSAKVLRLLNDVDRLEIDVTDLIEQLSASIPLQTAEQIKQTIVVPDTPYDPGLWHGADDEGVGGYRPHHV